MGKMIKTKFELNHSSIFHPKLVPERIMLTSHHFRFKDSKTHVEIEFEKSEMMELFNLINKFGEQQEKRISISQSVASEIRSIIEDSDHPKKAFLKSMLT